MPQFPTYRLPTVPFGGRLGLDVLYPTFIIFLCIHSTDSKKYPMLQIRTYTQLETYELSLAIPLVASFQTLLCPGANLP
jgi:hypothetical protein